MEIATIQCRAKPPTADPPVEVLSARLEALEREVVELRGANREPSSQVQAVPARDQLAVVVFSDDLDRLLATLTMANGAAMMGAEVRLFFTFWATAALRGKRSGTRRTLMDRMFGWLLPSGPNKLGLSRMHYGGLGTAALKWRMAQKNVAGLEEQLAMAAELGVKIYVCEMSMDLLGLHRDDLLETLDIELCGVATFMSHAMDSNVTMFL